jgi:hypothetical protein
VPTTSPSSFLTELQGVNVFRYTGYFETFLVPEGVEAFYVYIWGAGGSYGVNGAYVEGLLPVTPGQHVTVIVGQAGIYGTSASFGGGGAGGSISGGYAYSGCGGGGRSAIQIDYEDAVTAGGGGGGYYGGHATSYMNDAIQNVSYQGGYGTVTMSTQAINCNGGGGGSVTEGGQGDYCWGGQSGSRYQGGNGNKWGGGGGGGGYYGGGGGYYGGGGASYLYNLLLYDMSDTSTARGVCAGQYSKYFSTCADSCGTSNQNGCMVIELIHETLVQPSAVPSFGVVDRLIPMRRCRISQ